MMGNFVAHPDSSSRRNFPGAVSDWIFTEESSPVEGFTAMRNFFTGTEFPEAGVHDDHEGFYVVAGEGTIRIAGEETSLSPGMAILVPAGVPHAIRKRGSRDLEIFIFHFPAKEGTI